MLLLRLQTTLLSNSFSSELSTNPSHRRPNSELRDTSQCSVEAISVEKSIEHLEPNQ
jgi:hypothetical protein